MTGSGEGCSVSDLAVSASRPGTGSFAERVLEAITVGMVTRVDSLTPAMTPVPAGESVTASTFDLEAGEIRVDYHVRDVRIASCTVRVDERSRSVILGPLAPDRYERSYNGFRTLLDLHEQLVEHLAGTPCVLRATVTGDDSHLWTPYFDWAQDLGNLNAVNLEQAVTAVHRIAQDQSVWHARDLPERVRSIAGAHGTWRRLVAATTPAQLAAALEALNPGLARAVFVRMGVWHGMRVVR
jgi:hypothetical protein